MTIPTTQLEDAQKLTNEALVELFMLILTNGSQIYLSNSQEITWRTKTYEFIPIKVDGVERSAGDELSRPRCTIANPAGLFSSLVGQGVLDNAELTRFRVLKTDMLANNSNYTSRTWRVRRVTSLNRSVIQLELREAFDGQFFLTPARMFIPPEFAQVKLS